ncbi:MAG TPA: helix-turn-helix transcriptional regulator [Candidatus Alectryocaccomicrobium excrementavium]|uniref:Helix-turn-helix transcriptional regulator n=1 Tax=Candidatus Alectryocaccomicrobium excrementavium TaxID=2840668 RepID=A0A9D1G297_9FIRM|nr:helix-turn-helix transcriptional regulator [Candidatus Alectryocaccomicrobium excrementavium]
MTAHFRNRYFLRLLISYAVAFFALFFALLCVAWVREQRGQRERQVAEVESEARLLAQVVDDKFSELSNTCVQLLDNSWLSAVRSESDILQAKITIFRRREICEIMADYAGMTGIVRSAALLLPQKYEAIDGTTFWDSIDRYLDAEGIYQENLADEMYAAVRDAYGGLVLFPLENGNFAVLQQLDIREEPEMIFFFLVDGQRFGRLLQRNHRFGALDFSIIVEGDALYHWSEGGASGATMELTFSQSMFGWAYRMQVPAPAAEGSAIFWALSSVVLALVLGVGLALMMTALTYRPVLAFLRRLGIMRVDGAGEFDAVARKFEEVLQSQRAQETLAGRYYASARNNLLLSLLHGTFARKISDETMALFNIPFRRSDNAFHLVMILTCAPGRGGSRAADIMRVQDFLAERGFPVQECVTNENEMILIFTQEGPSGKAGEYRRLSRYIGQLREFCQKAPCEYICLSGTPHYGLIGISKSYQEALEQRTDAETGKLNGYYFPLDWEIQLISLLRACDGSAAERILQELQRENLARGLSEAQHRQGILLIGEVIVRVAGELNVELGGTREKLADSLEQADQAAAWGALMDLADALCRSMGSGEDAAELGEQIRDFVEAEYRDVNLSQKMIADRFQISCPSLSKMFKRVTGQNFIDYLHALRTGAAKAAFDAGESDVIKVGRDCGYENAVTFRRAFFRAYAVTPHQYVQRLEEIRK